MTDPDLFSWVLAPVAPREFEARFYQQSVCVVRRGEPSYYDRLLSLAHIDRILQTHRLHHPELVLVQANRDIPRTDYTDDQGIVKPETVAQFFGDGATLVFNHLHMRVPELATFCARLGSTLSSSLQANAYLTPGGSQGFKPHWDSHDVFVLQVEGSKRWTTYDAKIDLPLRGQQFDKETPGPAAGTFELSSGDMAYIPRGLIHSAESTEGPSLHLTVGLMAHTWADVFLEAVAGAAVSDVAFRENLPLGFAGANYPEETRTKMYRDRLRRLHSILETASVLPVVCDELNAKRTGICGNLLRQVTHIHHLTLDSMVRRRDDRAWVVADGEEYCTLILGEKKLELPRRVYPALRFLLGMDGVAVREIPDCLDDEGKLTLVRRLIKEGALECPEFGV